MLPAALMRLEALPHNSSGKLGSQGCPTPAASEPQVYVAPANELEQQLLVRWAGGAASAGRSGMTDDFFSCWAAPRSRPFPVLSAWAN